MTSRTVIVRRRGTARSRHPSHGNANWQRELRSGFFHRPRRRSTNQPLPASTTGAATSAPGTGPTPRQACSCSPGISREAIEPPRRAVIDLEFDRQASTKRPAPTRPAIRTAEPPTLTDRLHPAPRDASHETRRAKSRTGPERDEPRTGQAEEVRTGGARARSGTERERFDNLDPGTTHPSTQHSGAHPSTTACEQQAGPANRRTPATPRSIDQPGAHRSSSALPANATHPSTSDRETVSTATVFEVSHIATHGDQAPRSREFTIVERYSVYLTFLPPCCCCYERDFLGTAPDPTNIRSIDSFGEWQLRPSLS